MIRIDEPFELLDEAVLRTMLTIQKRRNNRQAHFGPA